MIRIFHDKIKRILAKINETVYRDPSIFDCMCSSRNKGPSSRPKSTIQFSSILDFWELEILYQDNTVIHQVLLPHHLDREVIRVCLKF